ncbi:MAG: chemotaxis protein CheB [Chitinophagaceae bacterium]
MNTNKKEQKFIVVIGASAGGLNALAELVGQLQPGMGAAYFVVMHLSRKGIGNFLTHRLQQHTSMTCRVPVNGEPILEDHIYIANPNQHMLLDEKHIVIGHGPQENRWRPSIDVLFRSAAVAHNSHVIGIILTGLLDDGTSGMWAIGQCGGASIVQDPNEAEYPDMPLAVLNNMEVDYCVSLGEMGALLQRITSGRHIPPHQVPEEIKAEAEISYKVVTSIDAVSQLGEHSIFACPDCGGGLWHIANNNMTKYRCHIGHSYSEKDLMVKQTDKIESTLWVALRMMEERKRLLQKLQNDASQKGFTKMSAGHKETAEEIEQHIDLLKKLLYGVQETDHN